jgi:pimeloyl-ACP methyl ester carboxylesterase
MTEGDGLPILLIHGNSSSKSVFRHQLENGLGAHRLIAVDLPGHGDSGDAHDPAKTYSMTGYADALIQLLERLGIGRTAIFGWSLGGHVGIEILAGLMISGTPPVSPTLESMQAGFLPNPAAALFAQETLTDADVDTFLAGAYDGMADETLRAVLRRTDGRARPLLFQNLFAGHVSDQRLVVERSRVPVAIVDGENDPFTNLNYIAGLSIGKLWERHAFILRNAGHAAFFTDPLRFNAILVRFADAVAKKSFREKADRSARIVAA